MARFNFEGEPPSEQEVCHLTTTQNVIAGRWKIVVLWYLSQRTRRFNELQKLLPGISKGILTRQLRELEEDGMVHREVYKEVPPKVEYSQLHKEKALSLHWKSWENGVKTIWRKNKKRTTRI